MMSLSVKRELRESAGVHPCTKRKVPTARGNKNFLSMASPPRDRTTFYCEGSGNMCSCSNNPKRGLAIWSKYFKHEQPSVGPSLIRNQLTPPGRQILPQCCSSCSWAHISIS